jgi:tetratricopeptide (TPR) repeat protein
LGACCLHSGDTGGARIYFHRAHETNRKDILAILGLAVYYLRKGETDRAVDFYLEVLELDPKNRIAKRAMSIIRKYAGTEDFSAWLLEAGRLSSLFPPIPFAGLYTKEIMTLVAILAAVCAVTYGILVIVRFFPNPFNPRGPREGLNEFSLTREERMAPVQIGGSYNYVLTRVQALEFYEKAVSMFTAYRDDAARVSLNRILESNAADGLKNRARIIISYLETPGFNNFNRNDNVAFTEVKKEPMLYNGVHVIWRGMATNITTSPSGTSFDFLVGYDNRKTLEGIIPVSFNYVLDLNPERPVEILGKVIPDDSLEGFFFFFLNFYQSFSSEN